MGSRRWGQRGAVERAGSVAPAVVFGAALVLALVGYRLAAGAPSIPEWEAGAQVAAARQLYVGSYSGGALEFLAIDPRTLADLPGQPVLRITDLTYGNFTWLASADGSTIAVMQYTGALSTAEDVTIRIVDMRTGQERVRFRTPVPVEMHYLTADGSRLFAWGPAYRLEPQRRFVWDTADGRLLADVPTRGFLFGAYDARGQRAYGLAEPDPEQSVPQDATFVAQAALSGRELGRVRLPGVPAGQQDTGMKDGERQVLAWVQPRIAVSPDGRLVVVLHADGTALTLVDAATLRIRWTRQLARATDLADPSQPRPAEGKALDFTHWLLEFSPDGRYLYTHGVEHWVVDEGRSSARLLGLRAIELERAEIVAHVDEQQSLEPLVVAPDGSGLYMLGPRQGATLLSSPSVLRRFDPLTLAVTAERVFGNVQPDWLVHLAERQP